MDVLYIYRANGSGDALELRCSLRSIAQCARGLGRVYIVGDFPRWGNPRELRWIPYKWEGEYPTTFAAKWRNMLGALLYAVGHSAIKPEFLVSMDDHYLAAPISFGNKYPLFVRDTWSADGQLPCDAPVEGSYREALVHTRECLEALGLPTYAACPHRNMRVRVSWLVECNDMLEAILAGRVVCEPFALLGNWAIGVHGVKPVPVRDIKFRDRMSWRDELIEDAFSTEDFVNGGWMHNKLLGLYPVKSKYEL